MQSGDDQKNLLPIQVVPRLTIKSVDAEVTPPPYVKNQTATQVNLVSAPALVADGSTIKVRINFSKPLAAGDAGVDIVPASQEMSRPEGIAWVRDSNSSAVGTWLARKSLRFHVKASDVDGFTNNALEEYELIVRPDQNPTVQIENPRRNEERTAASVVPLTALAEDDYGLANVKLVVDRVGDKKHWEVDLIKDDAAAGSAAVTRAEGTADRLRLRINYQWELSQLADANLKPGDVLEYFLLAKDNFALDGQTHPEVPSGHLRINIVTPEDLEARVLDELRVIKNQIQGVRTGVDRNRAETASLRDDTQNRNQLDAADRAALERLINQQATSTSQTRQLANRVDQLRARLQENRAPTQELNDIARDVTNDLNQAAENPMRQATNELSMVNRQAQGNTPRPNNDAGQQRQQNQSGNNQQNPQENQNQQQGDQQQGQQNPQNQQGSQQANANSRNQQGNNASRQGSATQPGADGQQQNGEQNPQDRQPQENQTANAQQQPREGEQNADQRNSQQANASQRNGSQQQGQQRQGSQQGNQNQQQGQQSGQQQNGQQQSGQQQANSSQQRSGSQQQGQQGQQGQQQQGQQGQQQQGQQGQQGQQQAQQNQPPTEEQRQRGEAMARAIEQQQQASDQLQRAIERMNNIGSVQESLNRLRNILEQQQQVSRATRDIGRENLGRTPEQMRPEDRERLNQTADQQQRLAEQTNQAIQDMQRQAQQMQRSDQTASQAMQRAAQQGQQQQTAQNQQRASQQARQNQQAQAQQAQRQAELGLQLMVDQLREAEQHRLAELQKKLAELQEQVQTLIRRQAGHNLDNINVQGDERRSKIDPQALADLIDKAERDANNPPPVPQPNQLSGPQEQTERNTRDIGKSAEETPDGAEAASHLTRAAGRMERAIVNLRDLKLADAYDPAQVEALTELEAALTRIEAQQNQANQQAQDQQRESLRQRYVKIKEDQQKLNDETLRIDKARGADGGLARADLVRLGQLPGEQSKLADTVKAIDEDLAGMNSTVYVWANKDIGESMEDVKADLTKQATGVPTQAEQTRIVEQVDAMIRNLAVRPRNSRFAQDQQQQQQQGQGQGQGQQQQRGPRLPGEAELRLLQDLQRAVNKSTVINDQQPEKDKPKLVALGNRQGDLRNLLDTMIQKASQGQIKLGPEPDNRDQLPEEAKAEAVENQELDRDLLQGVPEAEKGAKQANLIGDRMARSRQRLALNEDPGKVTQLIQQRIIEDFDSLIQQAQQQQAQTRNSQQRQRQQQQQQQQQQAQQQRQGQQPQNQGQQQQQNARNNSARQSNDPNPTGERREDLTRNIEESGQEWGAVSPRLRDAAIDGANENPIQQYRKMIDEYYRAVSSKGAGQQ
jgi:hypothetical protein